MNKFIRNGRYSASTNDIIYYENASNTFLATVKRADKKVEVYYGQTSGGGEYYDLPISLQSRLLEICSSSKHNTRQLLRFVRENDLNKKEEEINGLGVKLNLVGKDGNAYSLLSLFRNKALKQGIDKTKVEEVIKDAKSKDYSHLIYTLSCNCN